MSIMHNPLHPGEIVYDALFNETDIKNVTHAAEILKVDRTTLSRLLNQKTGISAEMALRLSLALNTSTDMWLNIQKDYDVWKIEKKRSLLKKLIRPIFPTNLQLKHAG